MTTFSLYELNSLIREAIEESLDGEYWVVAEIAELREVRGHCYMELVQKDVFGNTPVARASAKCWQSTWPRLHSRFEKATGQSLAVGMKVLLHVAANFHESYGFSWIVSDIDPAYTLGDMARKRQEIVRQLKQAGVFDLQKELKLPLFAQRIAVISSLQAAGYGDFRKHLLENDFNLAFSVSLFPAAMQGEQVEHSIIAALDTINADISRFDAVVIIRGGGATTDLSSFDTLALAENVAQFPLPIITGIGHERDESVLDMIAFKSVKTPTAAAAFLIDHLASTAQRIFALQSAVADGVEHRIRTESLRLNAFSEKVPVLARFSLSAMQHKLELLSQRIEHLNPERLLERGYSITLRNGQVIRDSSVLRAGDVVETRLAKGTIYSTVNP